jgi:hypothetical protein
MSTYITKSEISNIDATQGVQKIRTSQNQNWQMKRNNNYQDRNK